MARTRKKKSGKTGYLEALIAFWVLGVLAGSLGLTLGLGLPYLEAASLSAGAASVGAVIALIFRIRWRIRRLFAKRRARTKKGDVVDIRRGVVRRVNKRAERLIRHHAEELARRFRRLAMADERGSPDPIKWKRETNAFITAEIFDGLKPDVVKGLKRREKLMESWRRKITSAARASDRKRASAGVGLDFSPSMKGSEYEAYCACLLRDAGWRVTNKGDSADQGVDLIARKGALIVAIQCKRYRNSVGNSAVQEIVAGRMTVSAQARAAVVSNAAYTRAAKELAAVNGVLLLHHEQLPALERLLAADPTTQALAA